MNYELKDIQLLMEAGTLKEAVVSPSFGKWSVGFTGKNKEFYTISTQKGALREFKTLDAAYKVIKDIGFAEYTVKVDVHA